MYTEEPSVQDAGQNIPSDPVLIPMQCVLVLYKFYFNFKIVETHQSFLLFELPVSFSPKSLSGKAVVNRTLDFVVIAIVVADCVLVLTGLLSWN